MSGDMFEIKEIKQVKIKRLTVFALKIKTERLRLGMSQQDLADKCGSTRASISSYEYSGILPPLEKFILLCRAFDTTPNDFLGFN